MMALSLDKLFKKALINATPAALLQEALKPEGYSLSVAGQQIQLGKSGVVYVLACGKAAVSMERQLSDMLGDKIGGKLIIAPSYASGTKSKADMIGAAHPIPDERSIEAGRKAVAFCRSIPPSSLLITAISGGTSSLACLPAEGITLQDIQYVYTKLLHSGAAINETNTVRKHLSQIKGGQLLRSIHPNVALVDLILSDVPDDDPSVIGSGLTVPDSSTFKDAQDILQRYQLWDALADSVRSHIERGIQGTVAETIKPGNDLLKRHYSAIIGSARILAEQIGEALQQRGYSVKIAYKAYEDEVADVAGTIWQEVKPCCKEGNSGKYAFIYYGESTLSITGEGEGGCNQELAIHAALLIDGCKNVQWLSADSDGRDGITNAAGAIVDGATASRAREIGIDPNQYIKENDSYHFHKKLGTLLKTGPTGTNLMDIQVVVVERRPTVY